MILALRLAGWVPPVLAMFVCSTILYVFVRQAALSGMPTQINNLAMFAVPLGVFVFLALLQQEQFSLTPMQYLEIGIAAVFLSYVGNALSMRSISKAPNPGFSLIISKSYVVLTTIWAVVFLDAEISFQKVIGIVLVLVGSSVIMVHRHVKQPSNESRSWALSTARAWIIEAIGAFFCWGFLSLVGKHLQSQGVATTVFLSYIFAIVNLCIVLELWFTKIAITAVLASWKSIAMIGVAASGFNYFNFYSIKVAPNVGYVNAANAGSIAAVTLLAAFIFHDELTTQKLLGVMCAFAGLIFVLF